MDSSTVHMRMLQVIKSLVLTLRVYCSCEGELGSGLGLLGNGRCRRCGRDREVTSVVGGGVWFCAVAVSGVGNF